MLNRLARPLLVPAAFLFVIAAATFTTSTARAEYFDKFAWQEVNSGAGVTWNARAGLQALNHRGKFYVLGGRAPKVVPATFGDSEFFNDVWKSSNAGRTWARVSGGHGAPWRARAYFQAVTKGRYMYVLGGQDSMAVEIPPFLKCPFPVPDGVPCVVLSSTFFNDVWRSPDGVRWQKMTDDAAWSGRAGLSAVTLNGWIYVMGGSVNDDSAITPTGPARIYYNDVYRSRNGKHWQKVTDQAPWTPRAGAVVVAKGGYMYLLGGEDGFVCDFSNPADPCPYFNDVWRSRDGENWTLVTAAAGWSARPGHQCEVLRRTFVCFGGFGQSPAGPFVPANPMDIWVSRDGASWTQLAGSASPPWNATSPADIKYDFAAFAAHGVRGRSQPSIFTFGGDRETFNPFDPLAFEKVDNDVWQFTFKRRNGKK